ncbi:type II toxin-antitoxin system HicB family antitoxin [Acinetobacter sp. YH12142]|uniref:type II toxin-antitoxin system HicB family antitoxin n=1 Tax=Acinetobacter sp. YH12142 TaxID=2601126 RepID=UPI0015D2AB53|nr:type II toxin-antitoxin system HicB family antitoxin [Acinetobacter sp. YH12142]
MLLPIAIDLSNGTPYAVYFPSLYGCNAVGDSIETAIINAIEAAEEHIEILLEDGDSLPHPINIHDLMQLQEYQQCVWKLIQINA